MSSAMTRQERIRRLLYSSIGAVVIAAIVLTINFLVSFVPLRLDTSEGKVYSLSDGSKKILGQLDDNLVVKVAFTRNLPPPYSLNEKYIHNLLSEYRRASNGHIKIEYYDPSASDAIKNEMLSYGLSPAHLDVREKDRRELKECFMGLVFLYHNRQEIVPLVQNVQGLEYEITQRIKRLIKPEKINLGIISSGDALTFKGEELKAVGQLARQLYQVEDVDLSTTVSNGFQVLWMVGPKDKIKPEQVGRLRKWVEDGNTLGLLLDAYDVKVEQFQPSPVDTGLEGLLKEWGVDIRPGLIFDEQSDRIQVRTQQGYFQMINVIDYPYFPLVSNLDRENPALKDLDAVSFPFASPIILSTPAPQGLVYTPLARTSNRSWLNTYPYVISPVSELTKPADAVDGPFNVGVLIEGKFKKGDPNAKSGRVIIVGCSRFVRSDYPLRPTNYVAFMNLLDWSAQDDVLLSIRSKASPRRPLKDLSDPARLLIKFLMIIMLPISVLVIGIVVWLRQRIRRRGLRRFYSEA